MPIGLNPARVLRALCAVLFLFAACFAQAALAAPPTNVQASQGATTEGIEITWDAVPDITAYRLFRSASRNGEKVAIGITFETHFLDTLVQAASTNFYWVTTFLNGVDGPLSEPTHGFRKLAVPEQFGATTRKFSDRIHLSWLPVPGGLEYDLYRATSVEGERVRVGTTQDTSFDDANLAPSTKYYYWVRARYGVRRGDLGAPTQGETREKIIAFPPPSNVRASLEEFEDKVLVTWDSVPGATEYEIYAVKLDNYDRENPPDVERQFVGSMTSTAFEHTNITLNFETVLIRDFFSILQYFVRAVGENGESEFSSPVQGSLTPPLDPDMPAPINVSASDGKKPHIEVTWDVAGNRSGSAKVQRAIGSGTRELLTKRGGNPFLDVTAKPNIEYTYWVSLLTFGGEGALSEPDTGTALELNVPAELSIALPDGDIASEENVPTPLLFRADAMTARPGRIEPFPGGFFVGQFRLTNGMPSDSEWTLEIKASSGRFSPGSFATVRAWDASENGFHGDGISISGMTRLAFSPNMYNITLGTVGATLDAGDIINFNFALQQVSGLTVHGNEITLSATLGPIGYEQTIAGRVPFVTALEVAEIVLVRTVAPELTAPGNIAATDGTLMDKVRLSWSAAYAISSYEVYRSLSQNGVKTLLGAVSDTVFDDLTAEPGITYSYFLKAIRSDGEASDFSPPDEGFLGLAPLQKDILLDLGPVLRVWGKLNGIDWQRIITGNASTFTLADTTGIGTENIFADFGASYGVWERMVNGVWRKSIVYSTNKFAVADLDNDGKSDVIADFGADLGTWTWMNGSTWRLLNDNSTEGIVTGDLNGSSGDEAILDLGELGVWAKVDNREWVQQHEADPRHMATCNMDGLGGVELALDLGPDGIQTKTYAGEWTPINTRSGEGMACGDIDGDGKEDLIVDFGPGVGLWAYFNNTEWRKLNRISPDAMAVGDVDGNGQAEVIASFGAGFGTLMYRNDTAWERLNVNPSEAIAIGNLDAN